VSAHNENALSLQVKEEAQRLGFELVGISPVKIPPHEESFAEWLRQGFSGQLEYMKRTEELRRNPHRLVPWAVSIVSVGMNYYTPFFRPAASPQPKGWISRYAWGDDYHYLIQDKLESLLDSIRRICNGPVEGKVFVDSGPVLEREFAGIAGIGWIGKNTCLITPRQGSYFLLAEILLDLELRADAPFTIDHCGRCTRCLEACPTACILSNRTVDARRCIAYLTIELKGAIPLDLRPQIGGWVFGCDVCQQVCPWNRRFAGVDDELDPELQPRPGVPEPDLISELSLSREAFNAKFRVSPVKRARRRGYLRNVAVALGNSANPAALPALARALAGEPEALVRSHTAWALGRIGGEAARQPLTQARRTETDPLVLAEIQAALQQLDAPEQFFPDVIMK